MRNAFARAVTELAQSRDDVVLLAGDIGNRLFDQFKENYPDRFFNCGVAEAGMTGIAAGLAATGLLPITYTITPFNTVRCLEQIRLDICYPNYPAIIVGTGAGLSYASLGATHHSVEDIALMRMLPNMHIVCPGDPLEVELALKAAADLKRPVYLRLGKKGEPTIHQENPSFEIGKGIVLRNGEKVALLSVGNMLGVSFEVAELLEKSGISPMLASLHTVKPLDELLLEKVFANFDRVVVIEEHSRSGGAGSAILEWAHSRKIAVSRLINVGLPDQFFSACGSQHQARESFGLDAESIHKHIWSFL